MTHPITGPSYKVTRNGLRGAGSYWREENRYAQKAPYNLPLPYYLRQQYIGYEKGTGIYAGYDRHTSASAWGTRSPFGWDSFPAGASTICTNRALGRLQQEMSPAVLGAAALAEGRKSFAMLNGRVVQATRLLSSVKRLDVRQLQDTLTDIIGYRPNPSHANRAIDVKRAGGSLGDSMLEVMFGWKPIISDVQSGSAILSSDFGSRECTGSATVRGTLVNVVRDGFGNPHLSARDEWWIKVKVGARVRIDNPNLYLANAFGLVNPLPSVWEVVPWSFVVDYFVNVNQFLSSFTNTLGLSVTLPYSREKRSDYRQYRTADWHYISGAYLGDWITHSTATYCRGSQSLPSVKLYLQQPSFGKDLSRVVSSLSLLLQRMK